MQSRPPHSRPIRLGLRDRSGTTAKTAEVRATHRRPKRRYKKRIRMPSKLDPYLVTIESWLATEPQITALAIVRWLAAIDPATFSDKQHSIVQRLIRLLRRKAAETVIVAMATQVPIEAAMRPGPVDGASCDGYSAPPTGPLAEQVSTLGRVSFQPALNQSHSGNIAS